MTIGIFVAAWTLLLIAIPAWQHRKYCRANTKKRQMESLQKKCKPLALKLSGHPHYIERTPDEIADAILILTNGQTELANIYADAYLDKRSTLAPLINTFSKMEV